MSCEWTNPIYGCCWNGQEATGPNKQGCPRELMGRYNHSLSLDATIMVSKTTLNFQNFKVALNPMYRICQTLPNVASYHLKFDNI